MPSPRPRRELGRSPIAVVFALLAAVIAALAVSSLFVGAGDTRAADVARYLAGELKAAPGSQLHTVVDTLRIPRTLVAVVVGCALGAAGALLQAATRNPLADTGLLGINSGASLGVVIGITYGGATAGGGYLAWALGGALAGSLVVLVLAGAGGAGASPLRLILAGAALGATLNGVVSFLLLGTGRSYEEYRVWILGSLSGVTSGALGGVLPVLAVGGVLAALTVRPLAVLALGDDSARALGQHPGATRVTVALAVTLLTAASIALVGPLSFLGLVAGYAARRMIGARVGPQVLAAAGVGATVLLASDIAVRVVMRPYEASVALLLALIGGPLLILIVRSPGLALLGAPAASNAPARTPRVPLRDRLRRTPGTARIQAVPGAAPPRAAAASAGPGRAEGDDHARMDAAPMSASGDPGARVPRRLGRKATRRTPTGLTDDAYTVRYGSLSLLLPRTAVTSGAGLTLLAGLALTVCVAYGSDAVRPADAIRALFGYGDFATLLIVNQFGLPRVVAGMLAGAALGLAGCLTQTLARNRLATPDVLAVNDGATMGVLLTLAGTGGTLGAWWAGPTGALVAAALILLLAGGMGPRGYRVLVTGLALGAIVRALVEFTLARRDLDLAVAVYTWSVGSLNGRDYASAAPLLAVLVVAVPVLWASARKLAVLRFEPDVAGALGVDVGRWRLGVLVLAVVLAGVAVGVGGPIAFVALAAPVIAARAAGPGRVPMLGSALVGAVLVAAADTIGRVLTPGSEVPAGVITGVLGGPFLLWVLLRRDSPERG